MTNPIGMRPPSVVMRLERLGAAFPNRLSFMRVILRQLSAENAKVSRAVWQMDEAGHGHAVYSVELGGYTYSLVAFSNKLETAARTDRVIAAAWDATFVLFDGVPGTEDIERLQRNAPLQEAGRFTPNELVLCRANKSVRMFDHVVSALAKGQQPSFDMVQNVGYLMRTTAVYGNGKFGIADRALIADRVGLSGPFFAEMLAVWLVRGFTHDLVEHVAMARSPDQFVPLAADLKRHLGIGNATGLGMAPFLVSHPTLLNNWVVSREAALARVCSLENMTSAQTERVLALIDRAERHLAQWNVNDDRQMGRIKTLRREWAALRLQVTADWLAKPAPFARLIGLTDGLSLECQEMMVALVIEPNGDLVDDLADNMASRSRGRFQPGMRISAMLDLLRKNFDWALAVDFSASDQKQQFWYVSEEKQEPRLGNRYEEPGGELESPLDIARRLQTMAGDMKAAPADETLAEFLLQHPEHRYVARRTQVVQAHPYAELHDNLIADTCLPIDMLRCKLAFFGASKFDPKSDRWTRINMFQGAPLFDQLGLANADDWWLPLLEDRK